MTLALRSSSNNFHEKERLIRTRQNSTGLNRFLSFNENQSTSAENRRRLLQSTPNLIELLEEDEDDFDDPQALCHECPSCSKVFASEYGLNSHTNMYHPNQSILCSICHITFRSHRSLKTHQQRRHTPHQTIRNNGKSNLLHPLPNYHHLSSYLVLAFSSQQFPYMAKKACEERRLPLGAFSSQLYRCSTCQIAFPCSRTLKCHQLEEHEHHQFDLCQTILHQIIVQIEEESSRTVDELENMALLLEKHASNFGLKKKNLAEKSRQMKIEDHRVIYPSCKHPERTCANLCLEHLSSYSALAQSYKFTIPIVSKGNPFAQGSIVSNIPLTIAMSLTPSNTIETSSTTESNSTRTKRRTTKHLDGKASPQLKRKAPVNGTHRSSSMKPENAERTMKTKVNETKIVLLEAPASAPPTINLSSGTKKIFPKDNSMRSSSMSNNSSSLTTNISAQRASKRTLSPSVVLPMVPSPSKRRRARSEKNHIVSSSSSSTAVINIEEDDDDHENESEQENDDDDDVIPIKVESTNDQRRPRKKRQASSGSVEYVQSVDQDPPSTSSLNNIENLKSKSTIDDDEIIICRSPPPMTKAIPNQSKTSPKASINGNAKAKSTAQKLLNSDDHVRVRCKICGEILEGRSRFSQHVISQHGHLLKKNITEAKQQQQQAQPPHQTTFVR